MNARFTDRTVLVTGAGSGIGRTLALAFAREGARVAVAGRRAEPLKETVELVERESGTAAAVPADVTSAEEAAELVSKTTRLFGGLDVAINNAGVFVPPTPAADIPEADWRRAVETNLTGTWLAMTQQIAAMRAQSSGGAVVNISSNIGAHLRQPGLAAYVASKAAVSALTRSAARDHVAEGIRINAISPGKVDAPMSTLPGETAEQKAERMRALVPTGRSAHTEEIAAAALYLASSEAASTVGADLVIDGGASA